MNTLRQSFWDQLKDRLLGLPLQLKIMGLSAGLVAFFGTVTIFKVYDILSSNMETVLRDESISVARELASHSREYILINDLYGLTRLLKDISKNRPEVIYAFVVDSHNEVLAHSFSEGFPLDLLKEGIRSDIRENTITLRTNEGTVWDTFYPVLEGGNGGVYVGVTEQVMRQQIAAFLRSLIVHTATLLLVVLFLSFFLTFIIMKPVIKLLGATRAVRRGNYDCIIDRYPRDEVGDLVVAFNAMLRQLQQADADRKDKEKIRNEFLQRVISTQELERKRVSRELHDQTGQALASIMVRLNILDKGDKSDLSGEIAALKKSLIDEMGSIHNLAVELRPSVLDDMGLVAALELYLNQFRQRHGLSVEFVKIGMEDKRADHCVETCIYRIIQESLTNVVKHAEADTVYILLEMRQEKIRGIIEDNGKGFELGKISRERLGIYGMEERAHLLGGTLKVDAESGQGTMVSFTMPAKGTMECHE